MSRQLSVFYPLFYSLSSQKVPIGVKFNVVFTLIAWLCIAPLFGQQIDKSSSIAEQHKNFPGYNRGGASLRKQLAQAPNKLVETYHYTPATGYIGQKSWPSSKEQFQTNLCQADSIVVGNVTSIKSFLSTDESQVFTDYTFTPLMVLKGSNLISGSPLYITQPGGTIHIDGGKIVDAGSEYPSQLFPGKTYLLFLTSIDSAKSFRPLDNLSTYLLDSLHIRAVTESSERGPMNDFLWDLSPNSLSTVIQQHIQSCTTRPQ